MLKDNPAVFVTLCVMSMLPTLVACTFMGLCAVNGTQIPASLSAIAGATGSLLPLLIMAVKNGTIHVERADPPPILKEKSQ